ncbi:photosystem II protein D1 [Nostoc sp. FACHB-888]|nr:photosystem II protein D1 [Nostoc sp. FACHB-888]
MTNLNFASKYSEHWADVINQANLGMEVMHNHNAYNFPLDLAAGDVDLVALTASAING